MIKLIQNNKRIDFMKILNKSDQKLIADKVKLANNPITRIIGLLNRSKLEEGEGMLFVHAKVFILLE